MSDLPHTYYDYIRSLARLAFQGAGGDPAVARDRFQQHFDAFWANLGGENPEDLRKLRATGFSELDDLASSQADMAACNHERAPDVPDSSDGPEFKVSEPRLQHATDVENKIATKVVDCLLEAGYGVTIDDGEEMALVNSRDRAAIIEAMNSTDEDILLAMLDDNEAQGWIRLIYGNGADLISDYATDLESVISEACALADTLSDLDVDSQLPGPDFDRLVDEQIRGLEEDMLIQKEAELARLRDTFNIIKADLYSGSYTALNAGKARADLDDLHRQIRVIEAEIDDLAPKVPAAQILELANVGELRRSLLSGIVCLTDTDNTGEVRHQFVTQHRPLMCSVADKAVFLSESTNTVIKAYDLVTRQEVEVRPDHFTGMAHVVGNLQEPAPGFAQRDGHLVLDTLAGALFVTHLPDDLPLHARAMKAVAGLTEEGRLGAVYPLREVTPAPTQDNSSAMSL